MAVNITKCFPSHALNTLHCKYTSLWISTHCLKDMPPSLLSMRKCLLQCCWDSFIDVLAGCTLKQWHEAVPYISLTSQLFTIMMRACACILLWSQVESLFNVLVAKEFSLAILWDVSSIVSQA